MKPWHWNDGRQRADWHKVGRCRLGVVLFIVCQSGVSLSVEINYDVVLNVLYQASVFGNIFCVLREGALRSLICLYLASGWRQGASLCQQANNVLLSCLPLFDTNYLFRNEIFETVPLRKFYIHQITTDSLSLNALNSQDLEEGGLMVGWLVKV